MLHSSTNQGLVSPRLFRFNIFPSGNDASGASCCCWLQVFKVTDAMDDPLTQRRYYQYSHHPEFIQKKAVGTLFQGWFLVGFGGPQVLLVRVELTLSLNFESSEHWMFLDDFGVSFGITNWGCELLVLIETQTFVARSIFKSQVVLGTTLMDLFLVPGQY